MLEILEFIKTYGFPAAIVVFVLVAVNKMAWKVICSWIDTMNATINTQEATNKRWQDVVDKMTLSIEKHTQDSKEAHVYTRQEHKEMIDLLKSVGELTNKIYNTEYK